MNTITIIFNAGIEFWMYIHDKGDEFYLHYDFWPNVPFIYHFGDKDHFADLVVRKEVEVHDENCNEGSYNYFSKYFVQN